MIRAHFVFLILMMLSACQTDIQEPHSGPQEVGFYVGGGNTRTEMLENGLSAVWTAGDELALWARNSAGTFTLSEQVFKTYGIDGRSGYFTSTLSKSMPADAYTYFCSYPVPASVSGTKVTFNLPAVQDGKVSGGADIMIAEPVAHGALTAIPEIEDHSGMSMQMHRMMHQFRFYVPQDDTRLGADKIERIVLDFPKPVVGSVTLDVADPDTPAVLSNGSGTVTLELSDPIAVSKGNEYDYACVAIAPVSFASSSEANGHLSVKAYTADQVVLFDPIDLCKRTFEAGHSTPVKLKIKSVIDYPYEMTFTLAANNLGENPLSIRMEAPSGCVWPGSGSNVYTYTTGGEIKVNTKFTVRFENEAQYRQFSKKNITVTYDSENTITRQTLTFSDLSSSDKATLNLTVPYLFHQDFGGIPDFNDGHESTGTGLLGGSDTYVGIIELSSKTSALAGWYGTRVGGQAGKAVRIMCRHENIALSAYYKGRLYSPFITAIKDGKEVNVSVSFKYGGAAQNSDEPPLMYFGINYQNVPTNPDELEGDSILDSAAGLIGGSGFASKAPTSLSPMLINGESAGTGSSYTSFKGTRTVSIQKFDNSMRLGWIVSTDESKLFSNANFWLYIDDITVKIEK